MSHLFIGTAGWSISASQRPLFGVGGSVLMRYSTLLDFAEINSSFYRPHQRKTYERWAESVPETFRFSVKIPRSITHEARLQDQSAPLADFLHQCSGLGSRLAYLLVQMPPSLPFDRDVAAAFFGSLRASAPYVGIACEPRHPSWQSGTAEEVFGRHAVDRVVADPSPFGLDLLETATDWRYVRLHGSPALYRSRYEPEFLEQLALRLADADAAGDRHIVFDNTAQGFALGNALELMRLVRSQRRSA